MDTNNNRAWLRRAGAFASFVLTLMFGFGWCAQFAHADDIDYAYDEAGRLVQASNLTSGEAVRYIYDAAGNITSQISGPLATLAIGHFSPRRGPVGAQVTINGTGFSTTPANNSVRFNGVVATVVSSTQTKIVAVVPASATTGAISVEVASTSAVSAEAFVISATEDSPSIVTVLPYVSRTGGIVTIVGAGFEPVPTQNRVRFNNAIAEVLASTETTITARVPEEAGSGKIKVTTQRGVAVSPADFLVIPPAFVIPTLPSVERVGTDGTGSAVAITTSNAYGVRLFEGKAGDLLTVGVSDMTVTSADIRVYGPDNTQVASAKLTPTAAGLQIPKLTLTGTYSIYVLPSAVGSVTVGVFKPSMTNLTLGTSTPVNITLPGRRAVLSFTVPADTYVDVTLSGVTLASGTFSLLGPGGVVVMSEAFRTTGLAFPPLLKKAGQYSVLVDPDGSIAGSASLTISASAAPWLVRNGAPTVLSLVNATPVVGTFRGQPGEYLSILTSITSAASFGLRIVVKTPEGTTLAQRDVGTGYDYGGAAVLSFGPLPVVATYTASVQRTVGSTASVSLSLRTAATNPQPLPLGTAVAAPVQLGQTSINSFIGNAGGFLSLAVSEYEGHMRGATALVLRPDGMPLVSQTFTIQTGPRGGLIGGDGASEGPYRHATAVVNLGPLPTSGTYRVVLQQSDKGRESDTYDGQWLLTLSAPLTGQLQADGPLDRKFMGINGQGVLYGFNGSAGQVLALGMQSDLNYPSHVNLIDAIAVAVIDPDGNQIASGGMVVPPSFWSGSGPVGSRGGSGVVNIGPLPVSGRYRVFVKQLGYWVQSTGGIEVALSHPVTSSGNNEDITIDRMGQGVIVPFTTSAAGEHRTIQAQSSGYITGSRIRVVAPDSSDVGTLNLSYSSEHSGRGVLNVGPLPTAGTYLALVEQTGSGSANTGVFNVQLSVPSTGSLPLDTTVDVPVPVDGRFIQHTFAANQGSYRSLVVNEVNGPIDTANVSIFAPSGGTPLVSGTLNTTGSSLHSGRLLLNIGPLPETGHYSIVIKQTKRNDTSATQGLTMSLAAPVQSAAETIAANVPGQGVMRTFSATAGRVVFLQVAETDGQITDTKFQLFAPDGAVLKSGTMKPTKCTGCAGYSGSVTVSGGQLPSTGTYRVLVQQASIVSGVAGTGSLTVAVTDQAPTVEGSTSNFATTTAGQYATSTYTVSAGESFSVAVSSAAQVPASTTGYAIYVLRPDGGSQASISCSTSNPGCVLLVRDAPQGGAYQIQIRPNSAATISGVLTVAPVGVGELTLDTPVPLALSMLGQAAHLTFTTTTQQTFALALEGLSTSPTGTLISAEVLSASDKNVGSVSTTSGGTINLSNLTPGTYHVWIEPKYPATSNMQVTLRSMAGGPVSSDGASVNFTGVSPGQAVYYTFDAQAGESVGVALLNLTATPTSADALARLYVYDPSGDNLTPSKVCEQSRCGASLRNLALTGTYRIAVVPYVGTKIVAGTLIVSKAVTRTLTPDQPVALNLGTPGQPALLSFSVGPDQHLSFHVDGVSATPAGGIVDVDVYDSLGNAEVNGSTTNGLSLTLALLPADTYFVWVTQPLPITATLRATLKSIPTIATDGAGASFDSASVGNSSYFTFEAQAGESVGLAVTNLVTTPVTTTADRATMSIYAPNATGRLLSKSCDKLGCAVALRHLALSGTYRVVIAPAVATTTIAGTFSVSKAVTGTLTPNQPVALNLGSPGQPALLSFTVDTGQQFSVHVAGLNATPAGSTVDVEVYDSLGTREENVSASTGVSMEMAQLPADTYFVWVTQQSPMTGTMQVTLKPIPIVTIDGAGANFNSASPGSSSYFTFEAQAGESVGLALTNLVATPTPTGTNNWATISVYAPASNSRLTSENCNTSTCGVSLRNLARGGKYRVAITPVTGTTIAGTFSVSRAVTGTLIPNQPFALTLSAPGQPALLSFSRVSAQSLSLSIGSISAVPVGTGYSATVINSAGTQMILPRSSTSSIALTLTSLPAGSYTVWIYPAVASTATMTVSF